MEMNADLMQQNNSDSLSSLLGDLTPKLDKNALAVTLKNLKDEVPALTQKMQENEAWKKRYDEHDWHLWWNEYSKGDLEDKKTETLFLLTKASQIQLDAASVILQLSILIGQMECALNNQQKKIVSNQEGLREQQVVLSKQNQRIEENQQNLNKQNEELKQAQQDISTQNERLIQASEILIELRKMGDSHSEKIGKAISDYERIRIQLNDLKNELEKRISQCERSIPDIESFRVVVKNKTSQIQW